MTNSFFLNVLTWSILLRSVATLSLTLHPVPIIIIIIIYNILICLNISFWKQTYIFSLLYFLIIISGLLIIFLYFSSLISNEKSKNHFNKFIIWTILTFTLIISFNYSSSPNLINSIHLSGRYSLVYLRPWISYRETISLTFSYPLINITLMRITFLLISLLSIIKIANPKIKSLRKILN